MKKVFKKINLVLLALSLVGVNFNINLQARESTNRALLAKVSNSKVVAVVLCCIIACILNNSCSKKIISKPVTSSGSISGVELARFLRDQDSGNPNPTGSREVASRRSTRDGNPGSFEGPIPGPEVPRVLSQIYNTRRSH